MSGTGSTRPRVLPRWRLPMLGRDAFDVLGVRVTAPGAAAGPEPPRRVVPPRARRVVHRAERPVFPKLRTRGAVGETPRVDRPFADTRERPHALIPRHGWEPGAAHVAHAGSGVPAELAGENLDVQRRRVLSSRREFDRYLDVAVRGNLPGPRVHLERLVLGTEPKLKLERYGNLARQSHRLDRGGP